MGSTSEREYKKKMNKIQEKLNKRAKDVRNNVSKIEKIKLDALKKAEEMRRSIDKEMDKIERDIVKSKDLAPESKQRLHLEIVLLKNKAEDNYAKLRRKIAETIVPIVA